MWYIVDVVANTAIVFFFNDTATTEIYTYWHTLSLHDALPIYFNVLLSANYVNVGGTGSQPEVREPFPAAGTSIPGSGPGAFGNTVNDLRPFIESKNVRELVDNDILLLSGDRQSTRLTSSH